MAFHNSSRFAPLRKELARNEKLETNDHDERTKYVGTGDFHDCNNWRSIQYGDLDRVRKQHLCLVAEGQLETLTEPLVSEGLVRYQVVGTCVQVKEEAKKK